VGYEKFKSTVRTTVEQYHFRTWEGMLRALSAYIFKEYQQSLSMAGIGEEGFSRSHTTSLNSFKQSA
jgi:hypothetical protein